MDLGWIKIGTGLITDKRMVQCTSCNGPIQHTRLIFFDDLHHLAHMQTDLRALLILVVCDCHILVQEKSISCRRVSCQRELNPKTGSFLPISPLSLISQ